MTEKQIIIGNQLVSYLASDAKDQSAGAVVFLHGWLVKGAVWAQVMQSLEGQDYNLYALDLPGFGKSQALKDDFELGGYVSILKGFVDKLQLGNVVLVGHSFGGRIAIKFSAEYPNVVRKLVLVDSAGFRDESAKKKIIIFLSRFFRSLFYIPVIRLFRPQFYRLIGSDYLNTGVDLRPAFLKIVNEDLTELLPKIRASTLIIWGQDDKDTPIKFGERMHSYIPNSIFSILKSAGHYSFLDKPEEFTSALRDFIEQ